MSLKNLKTKIFLDSGDPKETKEALTLLGFLDGQTTNPTLIFAKSSKAIEKLQKGEKMSQQQFYDFYKSTVKEIANLIPQGSISLEVYADEKTKAKEIIDQARELFSWIENGYIKIPIIEEGMKAAEKLLTEGLRLNFTLCFSQEQAAAVYSLTKGAKKGDVFLSPFVGRLDDRGENGMDLIKNIIEMLKEGDGHLEVLTASVRKIEHLLTAIHFGSDIVTCPLTVLREWQQKNLILPEKDFKYTPYLAPIPYKKLNLDLPWQKFNLDHDLTKIGLERFASDWKSIIK